MNLPAELIWHIADYLEPKDVEALASSSVEFYTKLTDLYWQRRFNLKVKLEKTYKATFRRLQLLNELHDAYPDHTLRISKNTPLIELKYTQQVLKKQHREEQYHEMVWMIMTFLQHLHDI